MDLKAMIKGIDKGSPLPVYVCYGQEKFRMQEFISYLLQRLVPEEARELAVSRYDCFDTPLDVILEDAGTMPFMTEWKVILASRASFFTGAKEAGKVEHRVERLSEYLKAPADFSVIIFTVDADKLDERKKIVKSLKDSGSLVAFPSLSAGELTHWLERRAAQWDISFAPGAADAILMTVGTSLQALASELEKISLYVGHGGIITEDVVAQLVVRSTEQDVFLLIDDIVRLRKDRALSILHELIKQREEPIKIAALMARQFRMMLQAKELERQGYSQQQIAGQIGAHPYAVKIAAEQARKFNTGELGKLLSELSELDYRMKSGQVDKVFGLELFILGLKA